MLEQMTGAVCYVKDTRATVTFYRKLGFAIDKDEPDHVSVSLGEFWMDFHPQDKEDKPDFQKGATLEPKGAGLFLYFRVSDVDAYYQDVLSKNIQPSSEPKDWSWGNREFVVRDPDGYKLVFYKPLS